MLTRRFGDFVVPSAAVWLILAFFNWAWVFRDAMHARGILLMLLGLGAGMGVAAGLISIAVSRLIRSRIGSRASDPARSGLASAIAFPIALWGGLLLAEALLERGGGRIVALAALAGVIMAGLTIAAMAAGSVLSSSPRGAARAGRVGARAALLASGLVAALAVYSVPAEFAAEVQHPPSPSTDRPAFRPGSPNIILVSLDTVRPDHLSAMGYARPTSPNIDAIIRSGAVFSQTIASSSWTVLSHATLLTGSSPSRIGPEMLEPQASGRLHLPDQARTMAEVLQERGYSTAAFIGGATMRSSFGFDQGFDLFDDMLPPSLQMNMDGVLFAPEIRKVLAIPRSGFLADLDPVFIAINNRIYGQGHEPPLESYLRNNRFPKRFWNSAAEVNAKVERYLAGGPPDPANPDRPRFLFVHYFDAHSPYDAPPPFGGRWARDPGALGYEVERGLLQDALEDRSAICPQVDQILTGKYDEEIALVDQGVGRLMEMLRGAGLLDNSMVVLFSDHGESLGEHRDLYHGHSLHEELVRIVFAISYPGNVPGGLRVDRQARAVDIMPTILDLAGLEIPAGPNAEGRSLVPLIGGAGGPASDPPAFSELYAGGMDEHGITPFTRDYFSIREDGWKLVLVSDGRRRLYDLATDPAASRDLSAVHPQRAARMEADLREWRSRGFTREGDGEVDPDRLDELRGLGYISQAR